MEFGIEIFWKLECNDCGPFHSHDIKEATPVDHDYYLRVTLAHHAVGGLLDTGSEVCLLPEYVVHSNCIRKTRRSLKAANGTRIPILGEVTLPLSIGQCRRLSSTDDRRSVFTPSVHLCVQHEGFVGDS